MCTGDEHSVLVSSSTSQYYSNDEAVSPRPNKLRYVVGGCLALFALVALVAARESVPHSNTVSLPALPLSVFEMEELRGEVEHAVRHKTEHHIDTHLETAKMHKMNNKYDKHLKAIKKHAADHKVKPITARQVESHSETRTGPAAVFEFFTPSKLLPIIGGAFFLVTLYALSRYQENLRSIPAHVSKNSSYEALEECTEIMACNKYEGAERRVAMLAITTEEVSGMYNTMSEFLKVAEHSIEESITLGTHSVEESELVHKTTHELFKAIKDSELPGTVEETIAYAGSEATTSAMQTMLKSGMKGVLEQSTTFMLEHPRILRMGACLSGVPGPLIWMGAVAAKTLATEHVVDVIEEEEHTRFAYRTPIPMPKPEQGNIDLVRRVKEAFCSEDLIELRGNLWKWFVFDFLKDNIVVPDDSALYMPTVFAFGAAAGMVGYAAKHLPTAIKTVTSPKSSKRVVFEANQAAIGNGALIIVYENYLNLMTDVLPEKVAKSQAPFIKLVDEFAKPAMDSVEHSLVNGIDRVILLPTDHFNLIMAHLDNFGHF